MKSKKIIDLIILCISIVYMAVIGALGGKFGASPALHLPLEEMNQTAWRLGSPLFMLWMLNGFLGPILAGVGILLYVQAKGTYIWIFGIGIFLIIVIDLILIPSGYYGPVYGIGGGLIVVFFLAILWVWEKEYKTFDSTDRMASYFQLISYVFFYQCMDHLWENGRALL